MRGRPRARRMLTETTPVSDKLAEAFSPPLRRDAQGRAGGPGRCLMRKRQQRSK